MATCSSHWTQLFHETNQSVKYYFHKTFQMEIKNFVPICTLNHLWFGDFIFTWIRLAAGFLLFSKCFWRCCSCTFNANPEPRMPCNIILSMCRWSLNKYTSSVTKILWRCYTRWLLQITHLWPVYDSRRHRSSFPFPGEARDSLHNICGAIKRPPISSIAWVCATLHSCNYQGHRDTCRYTVIKSSRDIQKSLSQEWGNDWLIDMPDIYGHESLHLQYL